MILFHHMETLREEGWDNVTYFLSDKLEHKQGGQMSDCGKKTECLKKLRTELLGNVTGPRK